MLIFEKNDPYLGNVRFALAGLEKQPASQSRPWLNYAYLDDKHILYGSNNKRAHAAAIDRGEPGYYNVIKNTKSEVILLPIDATDEYFDFFGAWVKDSDDFINAVYSDIHLSFAAVTRKMSKPAINFYYFEAVLKSAPGVCFIVTNFEADTPLQLTDSTINPTKWAMIMHLRGA